MASLVPIIAPNIDSLIARYVGNDNVSYVTHELAQPKVNQTYFSNKRKPPFQTKKRPINTQDDLFCPGCFATGKELKTSIDFKHKPSMCPRTKAVSRFLQTDIISDEGSQSDEDTFDETDKDGNALPTNKEDSDKFSFQNKSTLSTNVQAKTQFFSRPIPGAENDTMYQNTVNTTTCNLGNTDHIQLVSDTNDLNVRVIEI